MKTQYIFHARCCLALSLVSLILGIAGVSTPAFAQEEIRLIIDPEPENHQIPLDSLLKEIWIESRVSDARGTFEWSLDGPGEFIALEGGNGGLYRLPNHIESGTADVVITVQFTNQQQEAVQEHVMFQLLAPEPTPTPSPLPTSVPTITPVPTPTPVPLRIRHALLEQEKFFLSPGENVVMMLDVAYTPGHQITITCQSIKGNVDCTGTEHNEMPSLLTVRYTAPESTGKDMVEVEVLDSATDETDHALIKIEVRE